MRNRIQNLSHKPISKRKVYNKTNEIDLCRCCHAQGSFTHLYAPHVWRNTEVVVYSDLLRECIGVELFMVTEPSHGNACAICDDCIEQLHGAMWFKKQILKCEMQFRELYTKHVIEDSFLEVEIETNEPEYDCADNMESNEEALCTECGHNISDYGNGADSNTNDAGVPPTPPVRDFDDDMGLLSDHEEAVFSKHKMKEMKLANKRKYTKKSNLGENKKKAAKKKAEPRPEDVVEELEENDCADNMKSNEEALCTESGHDISDYGNADEGNGADINANDAGVPPTPPVRDFDDDMGLLSDHEEAVFSKLKMEEMKLANKRKYTKKSNLGENKKKAAKKKAEPRPEDVVEELEGGIKVVKRPSASCSIQEDVDYKLDGDKIQCCRCDKICKSLSSFKNHMRYDHLNIPKYTCPECSEAFRSFVPFMNHKLEEHNIDDRFKCNACEKAFNTKPQLKMHINSFHMLGKKHKCDKCHFESFCTSSWTNHVKFSHNSVKDFHCEYCKKSFKRKKALRLHEMIHTGEKRKVCNICGQAFVQKASLNYHMTKYHPD